MKDLAGSLISRAMTRDNSEDYEAATNDYDRAADLPERLTEQVGGTDEAIKVHRELIVHLVKIYSNRSMGLRKRESYGRAIDDCDCAAHFLERLIEQVGGTDEATKTHGELVLILGKSYTTKGLPCINWAISTGRTVVSKAGGRSP